MRNIALIIGLMLLSFSAFSNTDSLLNVLDKTLSEQKIYTDKKLRQIEKLKASIAANNANPSALYNIYSGIFEEYKILNADSAFTYANKIQQQALKLKEPSKINHAKINICFVLLSSGMFKEAFEVINGVNVSKLDQDEKINFFILKARACYDLSAFVGNKYYAQQYKAGGNQAADSAIAISPAGTYDHLFIAGLRDLQTGNTRKAITEYSSLIAKSNPASNQYAILASTLSYLYFLDNQNDRSNDLLIRSVIADIQSATKENFSMFKLAETMFKAGDNERAYRYIQAALADAQYYGAGYRLSTIGKLLPIIENKELALINQKKNEVYKYAVAVTFLILLTIAFSLIIITQLKRLKTAKASLSTANASLNQTNAALREANTIKDEYIGFNFNVNSDYIDKIERFKKSVSQKLAAGRYDEINQAIQKIDLKKERENLSQSFDQVFIKLFPNFVQSFNSYFKPEDQIVLHAGELLNAELRIFALIRLGIHDNDKIAKILNYSVNTIYSYKTKIKNKSIIPNDEFEDKIMAIKAD
ncbi:MAG: DUF6377 domain-containing protein [Mucilaginibacter sp.]